MILRTKRGIDESLDVRAVHGNAMQFAEQLARVAAVGAFAFVATWVIGKVVDLIIGLRVKDGEEVVGLDVSRRGEKAYGGISR